MLRYKYENFAKIAGPYWFAYRVGRLIERRESALRQARFLDDRDSVSRIRRTHLAREARNAHHIYLKEIAKLPQVTS